jgi:hypothetical protein
MIYPKHIIGSYAELSGRWNTSGTRRTTSVSRCNYVLVRSLNYDHWFSKSTWDKYITYDT